MLLEKWVSIWPSHLGYVILAIFLQCEVENDNGIDKKNDTRKTCRIAYKT